MPLARTLALPLAWALALWAAPVHAQGPAASQGPRKPAHLLATASFSEIQLVSCSSVPASAQDRRDLEEQLRTVYADDRPVLPLAVCLQAPSGEIARLAPAGCAGKEKICYRGWLRGSAEAATCSRTRTATSGACASRGRWAITRCPSARPIASR